MANASETEKVIGEKGGGHRGLERGQTPVRTKRAKDGTAAKAQGEAGKGTTEERVRPNRPELRSAVTAGVGYAPLERPGSKGEPEVEG